MKLSSEEIISKAKEYSKEFFRKSNIDSINSWESIHPTELKRYLYRMAITILRDIYLQDKLEPEENNAEITLEMYNKFVTDKCVQLEKEVRKLRADNKILKGNIASQVQKAAEDYSKKYSEFKEKAKREIEQEVRLEFQDKIDKLESDRDSLIYRLNKEEK